MEDAIEKKETLGQAVYNLLQKDPESIDVETVTQEMGNKEYILGLNECIEKTTKAYQGDFYITAIRVQVPLMHKRVYKLMFKSRKSCPTPNYDEDAWFYNSKTGSAEFLWAVPDFNTCFMFKADPLSFSDDSKPLRDDALAFLDGSLLLRAKKLNGEIK